MKTKKIIFVRHAKSSWKYNVTDAERPLKKRGINDANLISNNFKNKRFTIDKVFSSHANRAFSTCKIYQNNLNWDDDLIKVEKKLYDFSGEAVMNFISKLDNKLNTVVLFGHNHAFTSIVNIYGDRYIDNLPTSGLVVLSFYVESWKYVKYGKTELMIFPRDLK